MKDGLNFYSQTQFLHGIDGRPVIVCLLVLRLVEDVGEAALATVLAVKVGGHEHPSTTLLIGALAAQTCDLAILINLHNTHTPLQISMADKAATLH